MKKRVSSARTTCRKLRHRRYVINCRHTLMLSLTIISLFLTSVVLPITANISTGYLSSLYPGAEIWIRAYITWFWLVTVISGLSVVILGGVVSYLQLSEVGKARSSPGLPGIVVCKVAKIADMASQNPTLTHQSDRSAILASWECEIKDLTMLYNTNIFPFNKHSEKVNAEIIESLEKLLKHTRRSFIYLDRVDDFTEVAMSAYSLFYKRGRWKYAADLIYDIGRIHYELGKFTRLGTDSWVDTMKTCLRKASSRPGFNGYWPEVYSSDNPTALAKPTDAKAEQCFYEALAYAAKLHDLEGLSTINDEHARASFEKALCRAAELPDKILYARIKTHIARLATRLSFSAVDCYKDALAALDALDTATLDSLRKSDVINLKLICYDHLGCLDAPQQRKYWYHKEVELAQEYRWLDFQVSGYKQLAEIILEQSEHQTPAYQFQCLQLAHRYARQAWLAHKELRKETEAWLAYKGLSKEERIQSSRQEWADQEALSEDADEIMQLFMKVVARITKMHI